MAKPKESFMHWLGRQVGTVSRAVKTPVKSETVVYRREQVEVHPSPADPSLILRRRTIDEAVRRELPAPGDQQRE